VSGMWTSLSFHHHSISWPIDRVFRIPLVISWRPELTALLTALPRAAMLVLIVGITQAEALVLHLAPPAPSKREKRCITTNPLITTRRFDQRRCSIATEATMLAGYRCGFHAVISHRGSPAEGGCLCQASRVLQRCITPPLALSYWLIFFIATQDAS
jgi:hypothetical protein